MRCSLPLRPQLHSGRLSAGEPRAAAAGVAARLGPSALIACFLVAGCAAPFGVRHASPEKVHRALTSNVLSTGELSNVSEIALHRRNLTETYRTDPEATLRTLHGELQAGRLSHDDLFVLAELSYQHALRARAASRTSWRPPCMPTRSCFPTTRRLPATVRPAATGGDGHLQPGARRGVRVGRRRARRRRRRQLPASVRRDGDLVRRSPTRLGQATPGALFALRGSRGDRLQESLPPARDRCAAGRGNPAAGPKRARAGLHRSERARPGHGAAAHRGAAPAVGRRTADRPVGALPGDGGIDDGDRWSECAPRAGADRGPGALRRRRPAVDAGARHLPRPRPAARERFPA